jgi:hypothetical protein
MRFKMTLRHAGSCNHGAIEMLSCFWRERSIAMALDEARLDHPPTHGPGPPHRPHMPGGTLEEFDDLGEVASAPTAKTLSDRFAFNLPHFGHATRSRSLAALIARTSFSNFSEQSGQVYS